MHNEVERFKTIVRRHRRNRRRIPGRSHCSRSGNL